MEQYTGTTETAKDTHLLHWSPGCKSVWPTWCPAQCWGWSPVCSYWLTLHTEQCQNWYRLTMHTHSIIKTGIGWPCTHKATSELVLADHAHTKQRQNYTGWPCTHKAAPTLILADLVHTKQCQNWHWLALHTQSGVKTGTADPAHTV